jgi:hypothetical protein
MDYMQFATGGGAPAGVTVLIDYITDNGYTPGSNTFPDPINNYLSICTADSANFCDVPIYAYSDTPGMLRFDGLNMSYTYQPNPITIDLDLLKNYIASGSGQIQIPINITSESNGTIEVSNIKFDYLGGNDTVVVFGHTPTGVDSVNYSINYFYSNWDYALPQGIEYIDFYPYAANAKQVAPFGQTSSVPILDVTTLNTGGMNMNWSVLLNNTGTISCVDVLFGTDNAYANAVSINNSEWLALLNDVSFNETNGIWVWADYDCTYDTIRFWQPDWYFRGCGVDTICSEEYS